MNNLKLFKKNIEKNEDKQLIKKLKNSKKVRKQIINLKQDVDKPDFGRE
jgi:prephenate dehydrogenase/cyclohexadieny/prephenate dehydrogenase